MSSSKNKSRFSRPQVEDYEKRRYRGLDQRIVDWKERRAVRRCLIGILDWGGMSLSRDQAASGDGPSANGAKRDGNGGAVVLDAPCGYGRMFEIAAEAAGRGGLLLCADISEAMVSRAKARAGAASEARSNSGGDAPKIAGFAADIIAGLPLKPGAADVVLSLRLFHHLHRAEDRAAALAEFSRVARCGAVVSFYRENRLHAFQRKLRARIKGTRYEVRMLAGRTFETEAEAAGFRVVAVEALFRGIHAQRYAVLEKRGNTK
jgi:SAM-dependent methyltransferase